MTKQQAAEIKVKFFLPGDLKTVAQNVGLAIAPIKHMGSYLHQKELCRCWILTFRSLDHDLSGRDVRNAITAIDGCWVEKVRLRPVNLPILKHIRKAAKRSPCKGKKLLCKHIPRWTSDKEALAALKREDRRDARRREQRDRVDPAFPYGKGLRKPRIT